MAPNLVAMSSMIGSPNMNVPPSVRQRSPQQQQRVPTFNLPPVQYDGQVIQNSGYYQEPQQQITMPIQNMPAQRSLIQHDDAHGFDEYDEEDFRRDIRDYEYRSNNYHY
uniref:Uncharacterized protein n=1 Tax=Setaria digitata TaxID=48799 RepID=A0A915PU89_9BILA